MLEVGRGGYLGPPVQGSDIGGGFRPPSGLRLSMEEWPVGQTAKEEGPQLSHPLVTRLFVATTKLDQGGY